VWFVLAVVAEIGAGVAIVAGVSGSPRGSTTATLLARGCRRYRKDTAEGHHRNYGRHPKSHENLPCSTTRSAVRTLPGGYHQLVSFAGGVRR
jgi:hypothetical protein